MLTHFAKQILELDKFMLFTQEIANLMTHPESFKSIGIYTTGTYTLHHKYVLSLTQGQMEGLK